MASSMQCSALVKALLQIPKNQKKIEKIGALCLKDLQNAIQCQKYAVHHYSKTATGFITELLYSEKTKETGPICKQKCPLTCIRGGYNVV